MCLLPEQSPVQVSFSFILTRQTAERRHKRVIKERQTGSDAGEMDEGGRASAVLEVKGSRADGDRPHGVLR